MALILSGKGGVGKSTVAANLAVSLALAGKKVGLLDIDIHGPSIPAILGLENRVLKTDESGMYPFDFNENLKVMSIGFLLNKIDDAVIWRGPLKYSVIRQFLADVHWGELDYLIIDSPPGTGDEPLTIAQLVGDADGAIIITTPQKMSVIDVRKSIDFCRKVGLKVLGVIENMSGFVCPHCGESTDIFRAGGGERMAMGVGAKFLGKIPIDPAIVEASDSGTPYIQSNTVSETAKAIQKTIKGGMPLG